MATAAALTLMAATPAQAAYMSIEGGTAGPIAGATTDVNNVMDDATPGYFYGRVWLDFGALTNPNVALTFHGFEAGYQNQFWLDLNGDGLYSAAEKIFDTEDYAPSNRKGTLANPLETVTRTLLPQGTQNTLLGFKFVTDRNANNTPDYDATNAGNGTTKDPNVFASFILDGNGAARAGNTVLLALDDGGAGPDDNHDDMVVSIAVTPLPAAAWFLLTAIGGLVGARWLRKDGMAATA
ncbi:VPLPA-CTERM sorting domain-containing protein [Roseospira navarrensis]|nr:VPLPA-CTERM sorting domain-containing protein [Roseospira navarrensis]